MIDSETQALVTRLIEQLRLPAGFDATVRDIYLPLATRLLERKGDGPLLVLINGAQGTGKSTLTAFLQPLLQQGHGLTVAAFSLDDFYLTRAERQRLAGQVHPLCRTRGVPGTHDLALMTEVVGRLLDGQPCVVPTFDKAADERRDQGQWQHIEGPVDVVLFEGWCNASPVQAQAALVAPINELEANEDPQGTWRRWSNDRLRDYHRQVYDRAGLTIMLQAPDFEHVYQWRQLQEQKLRDRLPAGQHAGLMDEARLRRFIQHFERLTRHTLQTLPARADLLLPVAPDHRITAILPARD